MLSKHLTHFSYLIINVTWEWVCFLFGNFLTISTCYVQTAEGHLCTSRVMSFSLYLQLPRAQHKVGHSIGVGMSFFPSHRSVPAPQGMKLLLDVSSTANLACEGLWGCSRLGLSKSLECNSQVPISNAVREVFCLRSANASLLNT